MTYQLDGASSTSCPTDSGLDDGISDSCVLDTTAWTDADDHVLEIIATYADASTFSVFARY